jgi:glycosyltransferase involved in cell wall biosynthesis
VNKIKVLHINTYDIQGGAAQVAGDLVHNLNADCFLVVKQKKSESEKVILLKQNQLDKFFSILDKGLWKIGIKKPVKSLFGIANQFNLTYEKLKKMKEYQEANIIHLHNIHGHYFNLSALVKIASEKYIVWTLHDMWALTGGEVYTFENENYKKGIGNTPYLSVYPLYNPLIDRRQHFIEEKKRIYNQITDKLTLVPVSHWLEKCLLSAWVYNDKIKVQTNYNGIDTGIFKNRRNRDWTKPRILFFNIGNHSKGGTLFKNIIPKIQGEYELTIIGEPLYESVKTKGWKYGQTIPQYEDLSEFSINYIHLPYVSSRQRLCEIYNQIDILIFPSLAESFGLTVLEALACGVCVIASNIGGIPEVLDDTSGYLFKSGDEEDLLTKINYALKHYTESRQKADIASNHVEKFSLEKSCNGYLSIYQQIINPDNSPSE